MPVLSTVVHNPYIKAFYDRLKTNGKHSTLAQIAVMRKTMLIAHSLFKNNQKFDNALYEKRIQWNQKMHDKIS
jgi:transposase